MAADSRVSLNSLPVNTLVCVMSSADSLVGLMHNMIH